MFEWGIESLTFSGGEQINIEPASMLIFVGPNRGGKSTALRDINNVLAGGSDGKVVRSGRLFQRGSLAEFRDWLLKYFPADSSGELVYTIHDYIRIGTNQEPNTFHALARSPHTLSSTQSFFCKHLTTEARLEIGKPFPRIDLFRQNHIRIVWRVVAKLTE